MPAETLNNSYDLCRKITISHYENFPVASLLIPKHLRKHISAIYAFARIADDIADEGNLPGEQKEKLLNRYLEDFREKKFENHTHFLALQDTLELFSIPFSLPAALITAFIQDTKKTSYTDFHQIEMYCENSANPIGRMLLLLFGYDDEWLFKLSDNICTALQVTNFLQDIRIDTQKGRCYLPTDELALFDIQLTEINSFKYSERFRKFMKFQVRRTKLIFGDGEPILKEVNGSLKKELALTINGGLRILDKISQLDYDTLHFTPKLSRIDKFQLLVRVLTGNV